MKNETRMVQIGDIKVSADYPKKTRVIVPDILARAKVNGQFTYTLSTLSDDENKETKQIIRSLEYKANVMMDSLEWFQTHTDPTQCRDLNYEKNVATYSLKKAEKIIKRKDAEIEALKAKNAELLKWLTWEEQHVNNDKTT